MEYIKDDGRLKAITEGLIKEVPELKEQAGLARIGYQKGLGRKSSGGKTVFADVRKVPEWLGEFLEMDFVVTFYEPADLLTEEGLKVLMHHELLHIEWKDGRCGTRTHDLQDFRAITDVYGVDWVDSFRAQTRMEL